MRTLIADELTEWAEYPLGPKPGYLGAIAGDAGEDIFEINRLASRLRTPGMTEPRLDAVVRKLSTLVRPLVEQVRNASAPQIKKYAAARSDWIERA